MSTGRRVTRKPDCPVETGSQVAIEFEGRQLPARAGEPLAAALLAAGVQVFGRSLKYHRPRGPYCLQGHCSGCLMRVDGIPNVRTCQTAVRAGMVVERQRGWPSASFDAFRALDWLSGQGIDHHSMFTSSAATNRLAARFVRRLSGFGELPAGEPRPPAPVERWQRQVVVVGGGAAGLQAARELHRRGVRSTLFERQEVAGGRLLDGSDSAGGDGQGSWARLAELHRQLEGSENLELLPGTTVVAVYPGDRLQVVAVQERRTLVVETERLLLACGDYEQVRLFEGSDLPGVFAVRAFDRLFYLHGVIPGEPVVLCGDSPRLLRLAGDLVAAGVEVAALVSGATRPPLPAGEGAFPLVPGRLPVRASGGRWIERLEIAPAPSEPADGLFDCGCLVSEYPPAPAYELAHHAGCRVDFDSACGFRVVVDDGGRTSNAAVFAAGHCTGAMSLEQALEAGRRAATGMAESLSGGSGRED